MDVACERDDSVTVTAGGGGGALAFTRREGVPDGRFGVLVANDEYVLFKLRTIKKFFIFCGKKSKMSEIGC